MILAANSDLGGAGSSKEGGDSVYAAIIRFLAQQWKKLKRLLIKACINRIAVRARHN
jgi:hypothetical protein